jgi:hypothetical protein
MNFWAAIAGHVLGDYWLQTRWMAIYKSKYSWVCTVHVLIYTLAVCIATWHPSVLFGLAVFIPHWIADRFSLARKYMMFANGDDPFTETNPVAAGFNALVYVVLDNSFHLLCLWWTLKLVTR